MPETRLSETRPTHRVGSQYSHRPTLAPGFCVVCNRHPGVHLSELCSECCEAPIQHLSNGGERTRQTTCLCGLSQLERTSGPQGQGSRGPGRLNPGIGRCSCVLGPRGPAYARVTVSQEGPAHPESSPEAALSAGLGWPDCFHLQMKIRNTRPSQSSVISSSGLLLLPHPRPCWEAGRTRMPEAAPITELAS